MTETTNACLLDRTHQAKRLDEIGTLARRALIEARPARGGALLRLSNTDGVQAELRQLIDAEAECCPFLHFEMRVADKEVLLDVSGPVDAQPLIRQLFSLRTAVA